MTVKETIPGQPENVTKSRSLADLAIAFFVPLFVVVFLSGILVSPGSEFSQTETLVAGLSHQVFQIFAVFWAVRFGFGSVKDIFLRFTAKDLYLGLGVGVVCLVLANVLAKTLEFLLALEEGEAPTNMGIIQEAESPTVLYLAIFLAVVGAPLSEEIFFRGLCLRVLESVGGKALALSGSSILFGLLHISDDKTWKAILILQVSIMAVGAIFAFFAFKWNRLGPVIIGHMTFNAVGISAALFAESAAVTHLFI